MIMNPYMPMGGGEEFALRLMEVLKSRHHCRLTHVVSLHKAPAGYVWQHRFEALTPDMFVLPDFTASGDILAFLLHLIRSRHVTHVLVNNQKLAFWLVPHLRVHAPRHVVFAAYIHTFSHVLPEIGYLPHMAKFGRHFDLGLSCFHGVTEELVRRGVARHKLRIGYLGMDVPTVEEVERRRQASTYGSKKKKGGAKGKNNKHGDEGEDDAFHIAWVGRLSPEKGPDAIPRIAVRLHAQLQPFTRCARVHVMGAGGMMGQITRAARKAGVGHMLVMEGYVRDAAVRMCGAGALLITSLAEGVPFVLMEAMACGVPVVASNLGGIPELLEDGRSGFLCDYDDVRCFADRLARLAVDPALREAMGQRAVHIIRSKFDAAVLLPQLAESLLTAPRIEEVPPPQYSLRESIARGTAGSVGTQDLSQWADLVRAPGMLAHFSSRLRAHVDHM